MALGAVRMMLFLHTKPETENTAPAKPSAASSSKQTGSKTTGNPRRQLTEGAKAIIADTKDGIHTALDTAGIVVPAADAANAALYSLEGNVSMAALSAVAIIPLAGDAAKGGKLLKNVAESSADLKTVSKAADKVTKALSKKEKKTYKIKLAEAAETAGKKADEVVKGGSKNGSKTDLDGIRIINKKYAGKTYTLSEELSTKYPKGVNFSNEGFPNFEPYSIKKVTVNNLEGDTYYDFIKANEVAGYFSTPTGYTWHHVEDGITMMLVPSDLHGAVRHTGGASLIKKGIRP